MPEKGTRAKSRRERIEIARSRDILDVASELNMELVQSGRDYRWKEHDSLVISPDKNLWKWFSRNLGGDVISLVETIKETDFNQSVNFLNDGEFKTFQRVERSEEPFNYYLKPYEQPFIEARAYLREERGLSDDTIDFFLEKGVLAQANAKLNDSIEPVVVFKTLSPSGEVVGANLQGIEENLEKWPERGYAKKIIRNSDGMNGLHVDIGQPKRLVFAESPIDLMSYYELHKDNLQDMRLVSMDGLKESTIGRHLVELEAERSGRDLRWSKKELANGLMTAVGNNYFTEGKHADVITLAVDNDEAGRNFITLLQEKGVGLTVDIPELPEGQEKADWNSYLQQENKAYEQATVNLVETMTDTPKEHIREFFKTRISEVKTDYIYLPNGQENLGYYLDGYLFANHYAELDTLSPSKQVEALMDRIASEDGEKMDQKFLEETFGYHPDIPIEEYRLSEKNIDRIAEKEEQDFQNQFDRQSFAEAMGLMQKYSPEEVLNESNSYHDDIRYQSLLIDLEKVKTNPMYRFIERYINRDIDREALSQFSAQDFITIAKEHSLLNEEPSVEPWKALTVTQPVNSYTVSTDSLSKEFDNVSDLYQFVEENLKRPQRQELSSLLSEPDRGTPLDILMAIDSAAGGDFNVEVNGQSILDLFPDGINEEATEIYSRSSAEIEGTTMEPLPVENGEEVETPEIEKRLLSELQESLSNEGDLVVTIASDSSVLYTNTVNFDQAYSLNLEVHSPEEVDNLSDVKAPWSLEVTKDNQSLGFLAYGEDWGNEFDIEDELANLENWIKDNQVINHLYSQEEVNSFMSPSPAEKGVVGELKSYGTFVIDDDFLERRYGSVEHDIKEVSKDNKKSLEETQESVSSDLEKNKKERTSQYKGSLQPEAEGSTSPVPEIGTFDRSVTSRPTRSSRYLNFTIKKGFKSRRTHLDQSVDKEKLAKLNRFSDTIQEAAQYYQNELANSKISYFTADGNIVQVNFLEKNFMHLTGLKFIGKNQTPEKTLSDLAMGGDISFDDIRISNTDSAFAKIKVLPELKAVLQTDSFYFDQLQNITRYTDRFDSLIKSNDKDIMVLFKATDENGIVPTSVFKSRETLEKELEAANRNEIIGIYRERDGQIEQIAINDEYIEDNGEEMLSILQNKQYQELSNEQVSKPIQSEVTPEAFTSVLDAVYHNGSQIGRDNRDNIPEALYPAWDKYYTYAEQHDDNLKKIMEVADNDKLLDKTSDFYREWSQDDIYDNHYHVRLQELSAETSLPFQATDFIDYQDFARELYHQNQRSQSGDEVTNATVNFAIYAPGGDLVKEGVGYHIGEESKPISQLLGLGYRRLAGYQDLAQMDNNALSQLENQTLNQTIAEDIAEGVPTSRETRQEVTASHNEAKTITSEREVLKNRFQRRVEEILNESPIQNQVNHRTGDIIINSTVAKNNSVIINSGIMSNRQTNTSTIHKTPSSPSPKKSSEPVDYQKVSASELSQAAFQKIREYTQSPKDLAEYLDFMSKFPTLSPRNVALIQAQWPGANAVATYNQWQAMGDSLGLSKDDVMQTKATYTNKRTGQTKEVVHNSLSVKAGEKSRIRLFRPQMEKMIPVLDSNGNQLKNEKGNPKFKRLSQATPQEKALVKEKKLKVSLFQKRDANGRPLYTTYNVFELSQTTLKPESYPKVMPNRHYNFDMDQVKSKEVLEGLCDYAKSLGVAILQDDAHVLGNSKGAFDPNRQEILLNPHNTPGEKIGTTIHELAHATLHNPKLTTSQTKTVPRYQAELEAEMTSYLVSKHFGLDTGDKAFRYMANWTDNLTIFSDKALTDSMTRIHKTVMSMVKQVEQYTKPYQRNHGQQPNFPKAQDKGLSR